MQRGSKLFNFWAVVLVATGVATEFLTRNSVFSYIPYITVVTRLLEATGVFFIILTLASKVTKKTKA